MSGERAGSGTHGHEEEIRARFALACLLLASAPLPQARADEPGPPRTYELTIETVMPHLEEALRYATVREIRCFDRRELLSAFPILRHDSLRGCKLTQESGDADSVSYLLSCPGGNGTTGAARWQLGENPITGRLDVKLGGKNMTFSQRVIARPLGECEPAPK